MELNAAIQIAQKYLGEENFVGVNIFPLSKRMMRLCFSLIGEVSWNYWLRNVSASS